MEKENNVFKFVVWSAVVVILVFLVRAYVISMSNDGMIISEYKILDMCAKNGGYSILVSVPGDKYQQWIIEDENTFIRSSGELKIIKIEQVYKISYVIYYPDIKLCRT